MLDDDLRVLVVALAESVVANPSVRVGEVEGGPVPVGERAPDRVVAVYRDRILDPHLARCPANVFDTPLDFELRGVYAEHDKPIASVLLEPAADIGKGPDPVDAGEGPEFDQYGPSAKRRCRQRLRVEPSGRAFQRWEPGLDGQ
jgi:hypothetical protein